MPKCTENNLDFGRVDRRVVEADFDGGDLGSEAGVLLLRRADHHLGLCAWAARALGDERQRGKVDRSPGLFIHAGKRANTDGTESAGDDSEQPPCFPVAWSKATPAGVTRVSCRARAAAMAGRTPGAAGGCPPAGPAAGRGCSRSGPATARCWRPHRPSRSAAGRRSGWSSCASG
ncbi:MAG: hypothetical protein DI587_31420 [Variovorax paradoxus]|nr:MAG: hypothetical protein DI583_31420 [Variovorax paradoxus]PZQ03027.1 MAG: hypothetical protein DI587_31420 [Variovorax paradoxus]